MLEFPPAACPGLRQCGTTFTHGILLQFLRQGEALIKRTPSHGQCTPEALINCKVHQLRRIGVADMASITDETFLLELPRDPTAIRAGKYRAPPNLIQIIHARTSASGDLDLVFDSRRHCGGLS